MKRSKLRSALIGVLGAAWVASFGARAGDAPPEPDSYRQSDYRAPTPATLKGARVLSTEQAAAYGAPAGPRSSTSCRRRRVRKICPRMSSFGTSRAPTFPAAFGSPTPAMASSPPSCSTISAAGSTRLWAATPRPLVFYCLKDCWMSWNAARRALELGYRNVDWYPEGSDGWAAAGLPVEKRTPEPRP